MAPKKETKKGRNSKPVIKDAEPKSVGVASFKPAPPKKSKKEAVKAALAEKAGVEPQQEEVVEEEEQQVEEVAGPSLHQKLDDASKKKRRLQRRDTDQAVDRVRENRLKACSKVKFDSLTDDNGVSLREYLKNAIRQNRKTKKKFSCKFWVQLYEQFAIMDDISDQLPEYHDQDAPISQAMCSKMAILHNENPAQRKSGPLEKWLQTCPELNVDEVLGLIRGIQESAVVTRPTMIKCCVAILQYMARTDFKSKHGWLWDMMSRWADEAMACWYEKMSGEGISLRSFCNKYKAALTMFMPEAHLVVLRDAVLNKSDPDVTILQQELNKTTLAKSMFQSLGIRTSYLLHLRDIAVRLVELENQDFAVTEVEAFRTLMTRESELLIDSGYQLAAKQKTLVSFMGEEMDQSVEEIGDVFHYNLEAKIKTAAVASGQLPKLPWESVLYPGSIPGERETLTLPEELLDDHRNVREEIMEHLGTQPMTFAAMRSQLASLWKTLYGLERTCDLEEKFLDDIAEKKGKQMLRKQILEECLPFEGNVPVITDAIAKMKTIKASALCIALGTTQLGEVNGILSMMENIAKKGIITAGDVKQVNDFFKMAVKAMQGWCMISDRELVPFADMPGSTAPRGREALMDHLKDVKKLAVEAKGGLAMPMLQPFRTFGWMLEIGDARLVDTWAARAIVCQPLLCKAIGDKSKAEGGGGEASGSGAIVPVPSSIVSASKLTPVKTSAKAKSKLEPVTSETMLKFFNRKKAS